MAPDDQARELAELGSSGRMVTVETVDERVEVMRGFLRDSGGEFPSLPHGAARGSIDGEPAGLTEREQEVLDLLVAGRSNRAIADALVLSTRTVDGHVAGIYRKLGVHNRAELVASVFRQRLQGCGIR